MLSTIKRSLRPLRYMLLSMSLVREWRRHLTAPAGSDAAPVRTLQSIVLIPPDPEALLGSKGDEALIVAAVESLRGSYPGLRISVVTASDAACRQAEELGCAPLKVWDDKTSLAKTWGGVSGFDGIFVIGADVMDGYYSPVSALRRWLLLDLAARHGKRSVVLGCSFNGSPSRYLSQLLPKLDPGIVVNLRDPLSFSRFCRVSPAACVKVADIAFLLRPVETDAVAEARRWAESRRSFGAVVGFNIHSLLLKPVTEAKLTALLEMAAASLALLLENHPVSVLLLPHDHRGQWSDAECTARLFELLHEKFPGRLFHPAAPMSAAELKATAGCTDIMVTGRMHLAIAALGQGKPVAAFTYQDKFHGLFHLFSLPEWLLLDPKGGDSEDVYLMMKNLLEQRGAIAQQVHSALPAVLELSRRNLDGFAP